MKTQSTAIAQPAKEAAPMNLLPGSDLFDRMRELSNAITHRAFEIFEGRGRADGHHLEDWFRAESELLHPVHLDIAESDDALTVRAEVPGFSAKELEVGLENPIVLRSVAGGKPTKRVKARRRSTRIIA